MARSPGPEGPSRERWTDALLDLLRMPVAPQRHLQAAGLLGLFAAGSRAGALESIVLDRGRDPWVRTYVLRGLERRGIAVSDAGFDALVAEFSAALAGGSEGPGHEVRPRRLAEIDTVATLVGVAASADQREATIRFLASLDGPVARELLLWDAHSSPQLGPVMRDKVYERCVQVGAVDHELAWATLAAPASRAMVLGSAGPLDFDALERATGDLDPEVLAAILADAPWVLAAGLEELALPLEVLLAAPLPTGELRGRARRLLYERDRRIRNGERQVRFRMPLAVLAALPDGAADLDALLEEDLSASVHAACAALRLDCAPAPDFDRIPDAIVANRLHMLHPKPHHRPLLTWALESPQPAFRYAAFRSLDELDPGPDEARIERLRGCEEPLLRLLALGAAAARGDQSVIAELTRASRAAPHVVLRAQALRGLSAAAPRPPGFVDLCRVALKEDTEVYDVYYAPVTAEAALGLARHPRTREAEALEALVDAGLALANDEAGYAIESAIGSWLDGEEASLNPIWYWTYLMPSYRSG